MTFRLLPALFAAVPIIVAAQGTEAVCLRATTSGTGHCARGTAHA